MSGRIYVAGLSQKTSLKSLARKLVTTPGKKQASHGGVPLPTCHAEQPGAIAAAADRHRSVSPPCPSFCRRRSGAPSASTSWSVAAAGIPSPHTPPVMIARGTLVRMKCNFTFVVPCAAHYDPQNSNLDTRPLSQDTTVTSLQCACPH